MNPPDEPLNSPRTDDAINDAATSWLAQRESGFDPSQAATFTRWRDSDPRHAAAFRRAEATQQLLARLPETPAAASMLAEVDALCAARPSVIPFSALWKIAAVVAAAAGLTLLFFRANPTLSRANATYATDADHHRSIALPDGSTLVLSSSSEVDVAFEPTARRVRLQHGEAHFYVAKNPSRPFLVSAGDVTVRAVGTAFNVRRQTTAVEVLVTEGKVKVSRDDAPSSAAPAAQPIFLIAGERALIDTVSPAGIATAQVASASTPGDAPSSSRAPRLMFNNTPLAEVVERFNHYNRVQMEIVDADLAHRSVGGNFDADNAESFIHLLSAAGDVRVERVSDLHVRLHRAP